MLLLLSTSRAVPLPAPALPCLPIPARHPSSPSPSGQRTVPITPYDIYDLLNEFIPTTACDLVLLRARMLCGEEPLNIVVVSGCPRHQTISRGAVLLHPQLCFLLLQGCRWHTAIVPLSSNPESGQLQCTLPHQCLYISNISYWFQLQ